MSWLCMFKLQVSEKRLQELIVITGGAMMRTMRLNMALVTKMWLGSHCRSPPSYSYSLPRIFMARCWTPIGPKRPVPLATPIRTIYGLKFRLTQETSDTLRNRGDRNKSGLGEGDVDVVRCQFDYSDLVHVSFDRVWHGQLWLSIYVFDTLLMLVVPVLLSVLQPAKYVPTKNERFGHEPNEEELHLQICR